MKNINTNSAQSAQVGVLITNLGTPAAPTTKAVRKYLAEFLRDPRVVELPRFLWWIILHCLVLPLRPRRSAQNYQRIWTAQGSPLLTLSQDLVSELQNTFAVEQNFFKHSTKIVLGMRYGLPSIPQALEQLKGVKKIIILPLYPQYSGTTTASTFDAVSNVFNTWRDLPEIHMLKDYHAHPLYIQAIASSIQTHWQQKGQAEQLIFSFHGLPQRNVDLGDPYQQQCLQTATLVAEQLNLPSTKWQVVFQSRFGAAQWLQPYCDKTLARLPQQGINSVDMVCPGFAIDCLETLDEIARENKEIFIEAGGKRYEYIPALNSSSAQISLFKNLIQELL